METWKKGAQKNFYLKRSKSFHESLFAILSSVKNHLLRFDVACANY